MLGVVVASVGRPTIDSAISRRIACQARTSVLTDDRLGHHDVVVAATLSCKAVQPQAIRQLRRTAYIQ